MKMIRYGITAVLSFPLFAAALSLAAALAGCDRVEPGTQADSQFVIKSITFSSSYSSLKGDRVASVPSDGDVMKVEYAIAGSKVGNLAEVSGSDAYLQVGKVYTTAFSVTIGQNDSGRDRTGRITLSADGVKPLSITVIQSKENSGTEVFRNYRIEVSDITTFSASFVVTPKDASKSYAFTVVRKSDYESVGKDGYIAAVIKYIQSYAAYTGNPNDFVNTNVTRETFDSYLDDTEYYAVAFDLHFDGDDPVYSGDLELKEFKTAKAAQAEGLEFTISVAGDEFIVIPSKSGETYVCDIMSREAWDEYDGDAIAVVQDYVQTMRQNNYLSSYIYKGTQNVSFADYGYERSKSYVIWAAGYRDGDDEKGITTAVTEYEFIY